MGLGDMNLGHVSARSGEAGPVWMKPQGLGFGEVTAEAVVAIDLDGRRVAGALPVHGEWPIHTEIYRARRDIASVLHVHPPLATAWSATGKPVRPYNQAGALFADGVPVFDATPGLIKLPAQGRDVAAALGSQNAVLLAHHGLVTVGSSVAEACVTAYLLERALEAQMRAELHGGRPMAPAAARDVRREVYSPKKFEMLWDYWVRESQRRVG